MNEIERWLVCTRDDKYEVSSFGRVRRFDNHVLRKPVLSEGRYFKISLSGSQLTRKQYLVHILVCEAFHGPAPANKPFCLHRDDVGSHNHIDNLRWGTPGENNADAKANGHDFGMHGFDHCRSHTADKIESARALLRVGMSTRQVATITGVGKTTCGKILAGQHHTGAL